MSELVGCCFAFGGSDGTIDWVSDPTRIDRYEIRDILGRGAMGSVYRAFDPKLHREVALKLVSPSYSSDEKGRQRFHREARAIAALKHPNIVEIYDYSGEESEYLYLVMEKLEGDDLFNIINQKGVMPEPAAAAVGHELCLALQIAHDAGVIHRDLKPENVFMNASGRVVLTDFGVVKAIRQDSAVDGWQQKTDVIGTPGFMAPELMMNRALGPRTDIFALGALLYNIATGELPYEGTSPVEIFRSVVSGKYIDPRKFSASLSQEFCAVLEDCLQAKPKRRYRSAEQLREALKLVLEVNAVSDLRDDLRDYMRDPAAYRVLARRRLSAYLLHQLKVAAKDKDEVAATQIRERLQNVDPENNEVQNISGLSMEVPLPLQEEVRNEPGPQPSAVDTKVSAQWLYLAVGILAGVALILAGYLFFRPQKEPEAVLGRVPRNRALAAAKRNNVTQVTLSVEGGTATLSVDGKKLGKVNKRTLDLEPGLHVIEARGRSKKLSGTITVENQDRIEVTIDLKKGKIEAK